MRYAISAKAISPIVSAILLFIIALAIAGTAIVLMGTRASQVSNIIDLMRGGLEKAIQENLEIVYSAANSSGTVFLGLMNTGSYPIEILDVFINGTQVPYSEISVRCALSNASSIPFDLLVGDLCIVEIDCGVKAKLYDITIVTDSTSYRVRVYGR